MKKKFFLFLRIAISVSLIFGLFWVMRDKLGEIAATIKNSNYMLFSLAFLVYLVAVSLMGMRLRAILSVQRLNLSISESISLSFLGYFFNNFFPTSVGGDVVKAYYVGKKFNKKASAFAGVFMDRLLAMVPFALIPTVMLIFVYKSIDNPVIIVFVIGFFFAALAIMFLFFSQHIGKLLSLILKPFKERALYKKLAKLYNSLNVYRDHKDVLVLTFLLSLASQGLFITCVYIMALAVGVNYVPLGIFFLLVPIVGLIGMAPSINGLGVREAGVVYMFRDYMPGETAFAVSILVLAMLLGVSLIGGVIYLFGRKMYDFTPETEGELL